MRQLDSTRSRTRHGRSRSWRSRARCRAVARRRRLRGGPQLRAADGRGAPDWRWKPAEPRDQVPRGEWWTVFGDPVLNELEREAVRGNLDLQAAFHRVDQARAFARVSQADFFPNVNAAATGPVPHVGQFPSPVPFPIPSFTQEQWRTAWT